MSAAFGAEIAKQELLPAFLALLVDSEAEVRTAAAAKIPGVCQLVGAELTLKWVVPRLENLARDSSQHVRASMSQQITGLCPIIGKEKYVDGLRAERARAKVVTMRANCRHRS